MDNSIQNYLQQVYIDKKDLINTRLLEFSRVFPEGTDENIFEELVFCICTAGASAKMGLKSVEAMRNVLINGSLKKLKLKLHGIHRYPNMRPAYIVHTREYLKKTHKFKIKDLINSFDDPIERREFFAKNKDIKGIGFKESSHFLRNIGFSGYAILDKHILSTMHELKIIDSPKPPGTGDKYLDIERRLKDFAREIDIPIDELDLLLWSEKTGEILK